MEKRNSTQALTEAGICTALTVIFGLMLIYLPVVNMLAFFIIAVPGVIVGFRNGAGYSAMVMVSSMLLVTIFSSPLTSGAMFLLYGPAAVITAYSIRRGNTYFKTFICAAASTLVGFCLMLALTEIVTGVPVTDSLDELMKSSYDITMSAYQKMIDTGAVSSDQLKEFEEYYEKSTEVVSMIIPAAITVASMILGAAGMLISVFVLRRKGDNITPLPHFKYFTLPRSAVLGGALMYLLSFAAGKLGVIDTTLIVTNVQSILSFVFCIQGAAAVVFWLDSKKVNTVMQIVAVLILSILTFGRALLFYIGIFDICFNARKIFRGNLYEKK